MNSSEASQFDLPPLTSTDTKLLTELRRGLIQQAKGKREELQGINQQISAIERHLDGTRKSGT